MITNTGNKIVILSLQQVCGEPTVGSFGDYLPVDFTTVSDAMHTHHPDDIRNFINHPVIANTDAPVVLRAGELAATGWTWVLC